MKTIKQHIPGILIITLIAIFGSRALVHDGLYSSHDIWHQVARLFHYSEAILDGQFLPTWINNLANGFGYPLFIFSYHLPWLVSIPFILFGLSVPITLKILYFISFIVSGFTMYLFVNTLSKNKTAALVSSIIYMWAPYHFLTLFVSAAIGTAYAFSLLPLLFLGLLLIFDKRPRLGLLVVVTSLAGLILSHLMTFVYVFPFAVLYTLYLIFINRKINKKSLRKKTILIVVAYLLGFSLAAYYIIPLLSYYPLIKAKTAGGGFADIYKSNFVNFKQLVYSKWGFGPIISNAKDGEISFQIGIAQWIAALGVMATLFLQRALEIINKKTKFKFLNTFKTKLINIDTKNSIFFIIMFGLSIFGMLDYSKPIWDFATNIISLDYPFRLLIFSVFFGSVLAGILVSSLKNNYLKYLALFSFVVVALYTNKFHTIVNMYTYFDLDLYVRSETTTNTFHEYLPSNANEELIHLEEPIVVLKEGAEIFDKEDLDNYANDIDKAESDEFTKDVVKDVSADEDIQILKINSVIQNTRKLEININLSKSSNVTMMQFDFPGQTAYIDKQFVKHTVDELGRIVINVPEGNHTVSIIYEDTSEILIGKVITLLTLIILIKIALIKKRKNA